MSLILVAALFYIAGGILAADGFRMDSRIRHLKQHGSAYKAVVVDAQHGPPASRTASDSQYWVEAMVDGQPKKLKACVPARRDTLCLEQRLDVLYSPRYP